MKPCNLARRKNSGQVLVITSLVVVVLLLSTVIYVNETEKNTPLFIPDSDSALVAVKQAATHTLVSALVNASNGGNPSILPDDLAQLAAAVESHAYAASSLLNWTLWNSDPYSNGLCLIQGEDGQGVSSAAVSFNLNSYGVSSSSTLQFSVNVTSSIALSGTHSVAENSTEAVNLSCFVSNEDKPALAQNLAVYYKPDSGQWVGASPIFTDYGNGTYLATFTAINATQTTLPVSVGCTDMRGVAIWANATLPSG